MTRITLTAAAALATIAAMAVPAAAQMGAPVRTLGPSVTVESSAVSTAERKASPCGDKSCAGKPLKRAYAGAAPLGW